MSFQALFAPRGVALVLQDSFGETLGLIAILLAVLLFAYYATRYIGTKSGGLTRAAHMRVKERVMLAKDKSVVLLETKEKYYLLGVTAQNVELIAALGREELGELPEEETAQGQTTKGVLAAMGLFHGGKGGRKRGLSLFAPRVKAESAAKQDELDALLAQMQRRRSERYGAGAGIGGSLKPEFQEILKESIDEGDGKDDA